MRSLIPFCRAGMLILTEVQHLLFVCVVGVCAGLAYALAVVVGSGVADGAGNVILDVAVVVATAAVYPVVAAGIVHVPHSCPWFHTVACH